MHPLIQIYISPSSVFEELREKPRWVLPAIAILSFSIVAMIVTSFVTGAEGNQFPGLGTQLLVLIASFCLGVLIQALYFWIVGKAMTLDQGWSHWITLACWGIMPWILEDVVTLISIVVESIASDFHIRNFLNLSYWLNLQAQEDLAWKLVVDSNGIFDLWEIAILTIGFKLWSQKSTVVSLSVVAIPYVVVAGLYFVLLQNSLSPLDF